MSSPAEQVTPNYCDVIQLVNDLIRDGTSSDTVAGMYNTVTGETSRNALNGTAAALIALGRDVEASGDYTMTDEAEDLKELTNPCAHCHLRPVDSPVAIRDCQPALELIRRGIRATIDAPMTIR